MPGTYPKYPNTPEGNRTFNFWANARVSGMLGTVAVVFVYIAVSKWSYPMAIASGVATMLLSVWVVFRFNLGGRMFAWASPAAEAKDGS